MRFVLIHLLLWVLLAILAAFISTSLFGLQFSVVKIPIVFGFAAILFYANYSFLIPKLYYEQKYILYGLLSLLVISVIGYIRYYVEEVVISPYLEIPYGQPNELTLSRYLISSALLFSLGFLFKMSSNWILQEKEKYRIQAFKNETELKVLKNQLRPHFLFNSINNIYSIAVEENDKTAPLLLEISQMLRYLIYKTEKQWIAIEEEVHFLDTLIKLYALRFESIPFDCINTIGKWKGYNIPPLMLLPFIENIFKHGDFERRGQEWRLDLSVENHRLRFKTINPIAKGNDQKESQSGIGLMNVRKRLELMYPDSFELTTTSKEGAFYAQLELRLNER